MIQKVALTLGILLMAMLSFGQADKSMALVEEGISLHDRGRYSEAIDKYKEAQQLDSNNVYAYTEMAMSYLTLKDYVNTEQICKETIAKFPDNSLLKHIYDTYGSSLDGRQLPEEAIKIYSEGISKFPDFYMLHFNKGITEYNLKKNYEAKLSLQNAIQANPNHASSFYYLGLIEYNLGNRIASYLCHSRFLILEPRGRRAEAILPLLTDAVNSMYYQEEQGKTIVTFGADNVRTDTATNDFSAVELGVLLMEVLHSEDKKMTKLEKFEARMLLIFEYLKASKKDNRGFYWEFLAPYFIDLESQQLTKTFVYIINYYVTDNEVVENWIEQNRESVTKFSTWNGNYLW